MRDTYDDLLAHVLMAGESRVDRTGTGTISVFAPAPLVYNLGYNKVPLITSKRVAWKMATQELMWMLRGSTDLSDLRSPQMKAIWSAWANADGEVGPTYGAQYRNAGGTLLQSAVSGTTPWGTPDHADAGIDQLATVVNRLTAQPYTRRAVISLWSAPELNAMGIEPCITQMTFSLRGANYDKLHLSVFQRSADMMLGVPFDLYQMGLLTHLVARELSKRVLAPVTAERLTWTGGDVHVYLNQLQAARQQLLQAQNAEPVNARVQIDPYPGLSILDGTLEGGHIQVVNYNPEDAVNAGTPAV